MHKCWKNQDKNKNQDENRNMNNRALTCPDGEEPSKCADGSTPVQRNEQIKGIFFVTNTFRCSLNLQFLILGRRADSM